METKDYASLTIISVLTLATLFGFIPEESSTHVCLNEDNTITEGTFVRLSSTGVTAYPNLEDNKGYKRCYAGWKIIDRTKEIINNDEDIIKVKTPIGDEIECKVINNIVTQSCYYNGREALLSEFN